jgi:hypothetical protein
MAKKWSFCVSVTEYFLARKNWDQLYFPGDSREVVINFLMNSSDEKVAREHVLARAREDDTEIIIHKIVKAEIDWPYEIPQRPIAKSMA